MGTTAAIVALVAAVIGLVGWWLKRRYSPTTNERIRDIDREITQLEQEIFRARAAGDDARADALLERLHLATTELLKRGVGVGPDRK